jgi:hypothetical protein
MARYNIKKGIFRSVIALSALTFLGILITGVLLGSPGKFTIIASIAALAIILLYLLITWIVEGFLAN